MMKGGTRSRPSRAALVERISPMDRPLGTVPGRHFSLFVTDFAARLAPQNAETRPARSRA
jgi:hypothetical protein